MQRRNTTGCSRRGPSLQIVNRFQRFQTVPARVAAAFLDFHGSIVNASYFRQQSTTRKPVVSPATLQRVISLKGTDPYQAVDPKYGIACLLQHYATTSLP